MTQLETAVLHISDLHYGKNTQSFNPAVFRERLDRISARLARIRELQSGYDFDKLVIVMTGDVNDGSDIYRGQAHYQAITDVREQAKEFAPLMAKFARQQVATWGQVEIEAVPGNHGRSGMSAHEGANWDLVAYDYLAAELKGIMPVRYEDACAGDKFVRKVSIRNHSYLLYHGHDVKSYQGIPFYGILQRLLKWHAGAYGPFDVALLGHFHTALSWPFNRFQCLMTGTLVSDDEWARRALGVESSNDWWLFGVSDSRPITWQYRVDLR